MDTGSIREKMRKKLCTGRNLSVQSFFAGILFCGHSISDMRDKEITDSLIFAETF